MKNSSPPPEEVEKIYEELRRLEHERKVLLQDLAWREPDVKAEVEQWKADLQSDDPERVGMAIAYRPTIEVLTGILQDQIAKLQAVEKRIKELKEWLRSVGTGK